MNLRRSYLPLLTVIFIGPFVFAEPPGKANRASAYSAWMRGDAMTWDQLQMVAADSGISPQQMAEMKLKERFADHIRRLHLPLEVSGFSSAMYSDEEFRLRKSRQTGGGGLTLNSDFWSRGTGTYDSDGFISYVLLRANAYYLYRSHYDAEHCAWLVEEGEPSFELLRGALDDSERDWVIDEGEPAGRDLEYRRSLDPEQNPSRIAQRLVEEALRDVAQRAADNAALMEYRKRLGTPPQVVLDKIAQRERALAADFSRVRGAMTRAERLSFQRVLKTPFQYARRAGEPAPETAFDR